MYIACATGDGASPKDKPRVFSRWIVDCHQEFMGKHDKICLPFYQYGFNAYRDEFNIQVLFYGFPSIKRIELFETQLAVFIIYKWIFLSGIRRFVTKNM